jgi:hypothetical protein
MKKRLDLAIWCLLILGFSSCSNAPSESTIQTAIAETAQASETQISESTEVPTQTPIPTRTPIPTLTPQNILGSRSNPYPFGEPAPFTLDQEKRFTLAVVEVLRGNDAWQRIYAENMFNDQAPDGFEYLLIKLSVNYVLGPSPDSLLEITNSGWGDVNMAIVSNNKIVTQYVSIVDPKPEFDIKLYPESTGEGYITLLCEKDDPNPILIFPSVKGPLGFFSLTQ